MGWRTVLNLVPHAAHITSEQYFGIILSSSDFALSTLKAWFGTFVVEACTAENDRSLTSLTCMCGSVHGTHLLNTPGRNAKTNQCSSLRNKVHVHIHQNNSTLHAQSLNDIAKPPAIFVAFASSECFVRCGHDKPHCKPIRKIGAGDLTGGWLHSECHS